MSGDTSKFITNRMVQKNLFRRRLWVTAISLLLFFLYFVGYVALDLAGTRSGSWTGTDILKETESLFGYSNNAIIMIFSTILAMLSGIEGFAWMDHKKQIVFYESLPISRGRRFWNIVVNSFLIFIGSYLIMMLIGLLVASGVGVVNGKIVGTAFVWFIRNLLVFFAVYGSAVLAAMLTGNVLIAILADCVFIGFEPILNLTMEGYRSAMYETYVTLPEGRWTHVFSPLTSQFRSLSFGKSIGLNLCGGMVLLMLAYLVYTRFRKNEDAGKAVLFAPVRWGAKIGVSALGAFLAGLMAYTSGGKSAGIAFPVIVMIVTAVIAGGIMEVIYEYNIHAVLKHFPAILAAAGIAILMFCGYRYDWRGYDSWIPKTGKVSSAYLYDTSNYYTNHYLDNGTSTDTDGTFYQKYMYLTDIDSVNAVLKAGEDAVRENEVRYDHSQGSKFQTSDTQIMDFEIGYRMKNGDLQRRRISIPVNEKNTKILDRVVGTDQFREGYFQLYHDSFVEKNLKHGEISYWNGSDLMNPYDTPLEDTYAEFKKAYLKDLQKFNFTLASDQKNMIGQITVSRDGSEEDTSDDVSGYQIYYPVYQGFSNTQEFLQKNGIYEEPATEKKNGDANEADQPDLSGPLANYQ